MLRFSSITALPQQNDGNRVQAILGNRVGLRITQLLATEKEFEPRIVIAFGFQLIDATGLSLL